jgi:hypothetical protein
MEVLLLVVEHHRIERMCLLVLWLEFELGHRKDLLLVGLEVAVQLDQFEGSRINRLQ